MNEHQYIYIYIYSQPHQHQPQQQSSSPSPLTEKNKKYFHRRTHHSTIKNKKKYL